MATATDSDTLRRGEKVVAAVPMPGIPEGTRGKVVMVSGFTWIRYWVRFENGQVRGSIHRRKLARASEWQAILDRRARGEEEPEAEAADAAASESEGDGGQAASGEGFVYNGILVPAHLLERSKARRQALGK
jgi:hypothetical protein